MRVLVPGSHLHLDGRGREQQLVERRELARQQRAERGRQFAGHSDFPAGAPQTTTNNDLPLDTRIASLVFQAAYVVNGNRLVLTDGVTVQILLLGGADINTPLMLDSGTPGEMIDSRSR